MRELSQLFKALSEETRLEILYLLFEYGELCVCDVEGILEISQSKSSRHLRYLAGSRLVTSRREGQWVHYCVADDTDGHIGTLLNVTRELLSEGRAVHVAQKARRWFDAKNNGIQQCGAECPRDA